MAPKEKLRSIFWNANGWNKDRCDRIAQVAQEENADVICITDAKM